MRSADENEHESAAGDTATQRRSPKNAVFRLASLNRRKSPRATNLRRDSLKLRYIALVRICDHVA